MEEKIVKDTKVKDPHLGKIIGDKYRLEERLGGSVMGVVYKATHIGLNKTVAVKILTPEKVPSEEFIQRFKREAMASTRLANPHTVRVFDFSVTEDGEPYIVMEYVQGRTLKELVSKEGPLGLIRAIRIARQIAQSLVEAHSMEIVHRDLKPANIMLMDVKGHKDFVKILDFGIAKIHLEGMDDELTKKGITLGTPMYMAPEQVLNPTQVGTAADIYSLGLILYYMLTGKKPTDETNPMAIMVKRLKGKSPSLPKGMEIPWELRELYSKMVAKSPRKRPSTEEIVEILENLEHKLVARESGQFTPMTTTVTEFTHRVVHQPRFLLIFLLIFAVVGGIVWILWPTSNSNGNVVNREEKLDIKLINRAFYLKPEVVHKRPYISIRYDSAKERVKPAPPTANTKQRVRVNPPKSYKSVVVPVNITSAPAGASVYINNRYIGRTPVVVNLRSNRRIKIRFEKSGYFPLTLKVVPKKTIMVKLKAVHIELP